MKSEYFVLLPNDICCSLQSFAAIALKTKSYDRKFVTAKCSNISDGATLNRDSTGIAVLKSHGKEFTTPKEKADILDEQYDSVFTLKDPVLPQLPDSP